VSRTFPGATRGEDGGGIKPRTCVRCHVGLEPGHVRHVYRFIPLKSSSAFALAEAVRAVLNPRRILPINAYRCPSCGMLEFAAPIETTP
jgi:hypothetical protein